MVYATITATLKEHRIARHVLQADLAKALGVSQAQLSRYERGEQPIPGPLLIDWAGYLGLGFSLENVDFSSRQAA